MRSFLPDYELATPSTLQEALTLLSSDAGWRPIAGGTDLMVLFNAGKLPYRKLVSIRSLPEIRRIDFTADSALIGAAATYTQIRNNASLQAEFPMLCSCASWTGGIANQNRGTVGGNIVNASPAADSAPALLAYDAIVHLASIRGIRRIPYGDFHLSYKRTVLKADELVTVLELPRSSSTGVHYTRKVGARRAQAIAKVCIAARACCANGILHDLRLALGSVAPTPLRCRKTEAALIGRATDSRLIADAQAAVRTEISPITDIRSSEWYRGQVSVNLLTDFLRSLQ